MKTCPQCGTRAKRKARVCGHCGGQLISTKASKPSTISREQNLQQSDIPPAESELSEPSWPQPVEEKDYDRTSRASLIGFRIGFYSGLGFVIISGLLALIFCSGVDLFQLVLMVVIGGSLAAVVLGSFGGSFGTIFEALRSSRTPVPRKALRAMKKFERQEEQEFESNSESTQPPNTHLQSGDPPP